MKLRKKLIEVSLPLEAINKASAREKSIRHGHPSTLHLWWARRPLAAARAVIFAQMVDDPSACPEEFTSEATQDRERERLFALIEELVKWENINNDTILDQAREEIRKSWRRTCQDNRNHPQAAELFNPKKLPAFHDPFAGGGSLPLEAQRLGLEAYASDLNPVAVLINKAMIEIPPRFAGRPPVNPEARADKRLVDKVWKGAEGLAEDVRYYGKWMRDEAFKRIGHLYPKVEITEEMAQEREDLRPLVGQKLTVIAWIWARTVKSPNPAFAHVHVPLVSTFLLSSKAGKEAYVQPVVEADSYRFRVFVGKPPNPEEITAGTKLGRASFRCIVSGEPIPAAHIKSEGQAARMNARLMALVVEGTKGRLYLTPTALQVEAAQQARPVWRPDGNMPNNPRWFSPPAYGLGRWCDLFTSRQLVALTTFGDLLPEILGLVGQLGSDSERKEDLRGLDAGGGGIQAYAEAVTTYLAFAIDKAADRNTTLCAWESKMDRLRGTFGRQAVPMVWDYVETNPFAGAGGDIYGTVWSIWEVLTRHYPGSAGAAWAAPAQSINGKARNVIVSSDPPYYDNIGYADLSDFFYVWLRRSARSIFPSLFTTVSVPTADELVATPYRHGGKEKAESFFLDGMSDALVEIAGRSHAAFPLTIYYAFKQSESAKDGTVASTGWEVFLDAVNSAGLSLSGTWPIRTELLTRSISKDTNALASSIVLVCRPRPADAPTASRRDFLAQLKRELPQSLNHLRQGNIALVDLQQVSIGPGMDVFTRYSKVLDAAGNPMSVRDALIAINQTLDELVAEREGEMDPETRWALVWFDQFGFGEGDNGVAETLSTAKNTSVAGMVQAGVATARAGKVKLIRPADLPKDWDPDTDPRLTAWEIVHHAIRLLESQGEGAAARLVRKLGTRAEVIPDLCLSLHRTCEHKKRAAEAMSYNSLGQSWQEIVSLSQQPNLEPLPALAPVQGTL